MSLHIYTRTMYHPETGAPYGVAELVEEPRGKTLRRIEGADQNAAELALRESLPPWVHIDDGDDS